MSRIFIFLLVFCIWTYPQKHKTSLILSEQELAEILTSTEPYIYIGQAPANDIPAIILNIMQQIASPDAAIQTLAARIAQQLTTAPWQMVKDALDAAYTELGLYPASPETNTLKIKLDRSYQSLSECKYTIQPYLHTESCSDNPSAVYITYVPRGLYVQEDTTIQGDLIVNGAITNQNLHNVTHTQNAGQEHAIARFVGTTGDIGASSLVIDDLSTVVQAYVTLRATDTSMQAIALVLAPQGSGALLINKPDGTIIGGNARGASAIDLQGLRSLPTQVASGANAALVGGQNNTASGSRSSVIAGQNNTNAATVAFVGGGYNNTVTSGATYGALTGGQGNTVTAPESAILGGSNAQTTAQGAIVVGGSGNKANAIRSVVIGGLNNSTQTNRESGVFAGQNNTASGTYAVTLGGLNNTASGDYTLAAGRQAKATAQGSFVWADSQAADFVSTVANSFIARASGGTTFYSNAAGTLGATLAPNSTAWAAASDKNLKNNFEPVNTQDILHKVVAMPITTWSYKDDQTATRHMGPVAQDFQKFGLGSDPLRISTLDADGVACAAIQGLYHLTKQRLDTLEARIIEHEATLAQLMDLKKRFEEHKK